VNYERSAAIGIVHAELIVTTPVDDYELVDFGDGRRLDRLGPYLLDRPEPRAVGPRGLAQWQPDWSYLVKAATVGWVPRDPALPRTWSVVVRGQRFALALESADIGFDPEQLPCWRWLSQRTDGCYHIDDLRLLNLFAGHGGASGIAYRAGASVAHVEASAAALARSQHNLDSAELEWVHEDAHAYLDQALRLNRRFHLLLVRPCARLRGPHGRAWDISCDLTPLITKLPGLAGADCQGVWLSPRDNERGQEWNPQTLAGLLREAFPGRSIEALRLGLATRDGRVLSVGSAACWAEQSDREAAHLHEPLDAAELEERLDVPLDPVLSSRRTAAALARALAGFARPRQEWVLDWVQVMARSNAELAYQFAANVPRALELMEQAGAEEWLLAAMDVFDTTGLYAAIAVLQGVDGYAESAQARRTGVAFEDVAASLELFVHGLSGRRLKLEPGRCACTDTETLFLPELLNRFPEREENLRCLRAQAVYLWAQTRFGTFNADLGAALGAFPDPERALAHFQILERLRLHRVLARELPGLHRQFDALRQASGEPMVPAGWESRAERLGAAGATASDSLALLADVYEQPPAAPLCYQGTMDPARVARVRAARIERERNQFQVMLARMAEEAKPEALPSSTPASPQFALAPGERADDSGDLQFTVEGRPMEPPAEARGLISSIIQDFGDIPPEYLVAAGGGGYKPDPRGPAEDRARDVWKGTYHEEGAFLYNEWDYKRQHYRKAWCVLRESDVNPRSLEFVDRALRRHSGLIKNIRRTFEVLRGEEKLLKKQAQGDDVDIDALVEAYGDTRSGMELTDRLFTHKQKLERNIAVMFMVDMSGSTKGWINDAERESLLLLCEALESLGDRYAIYGFSGMTRKRCELYRVKRFDERYGNEVKGRIAGIEPQDYTRMGVVIRHLSKLLNEQEARTRLLITLSDGKPDDFDGYRGEYGIEDTRVALIEAKRSGIHPYCITIDSEAHDYLPHMYGAVNYSVIDEVGKLPLRVSEIYRKLTT